VSRCTSTTLTDEQAGAIFGDATEAAREDDGAGDVLLEHAGPVTTFFKGIGIVNSSTDFATIIGLPGHVKVVNQINWCGTFSPNISGCVPLGGMSLDERLPKLGSIVHKSIFGNQVSLTPAADFLIAGTSRARSFPSRGS
jgi:hypothetical protein